MYYKPTTLCSLNNYLKNRTSENLMLKSLYIGNLEWSTTVGDLKNFFSSYGRVTSAKIIKDKETGRAKGFGFVTMENADKALIELNGKELRGRIVRINEARCSKIKENPPENLC